MENILQIENVSKTFTAHKALDDVSLSVPRGSIYGLLGPNGAGKTTLIRIINRITVQDSGRVLLSGHEIEPADIRRIGYLPEERGLYKKMKVGEQAVFFARLKGLSRQEAVRRLKVWFEKFGIESWWNRKIEELSKGMAQKVQFIVTVLHEPELLIFDEPFSGFDPVNAEMLKNEILALRDRGSTIILSTHNMSSVEEICDHITLINKSHNVLSGSVDEIRRRHGNNIFEIAYRGEESSLREALAGRCEIIEGGEGQSPYGQTLKIYIPSDDAVRDAVAAINAAVNLRSFTEIIPSMNDIFIHAVNGEL
ncbi:MAG: ATP-binding cassette domain-containing protein [Alistipes sp.]|nr:ATP-binding cassette domain-containing protein [Alistipes sp.]